MMSLEQVNVSLGKNGLLRCYNLFPSYFDNIDKMTEYLSHLQKIGINVVWLNPVQLAGNNPMSKTDPLTGNSQKVTKSLYAMDNTLEIDPRFSVVKRDQDNVPEFTAQQKEDMSNNAEFLVKLSALANMSFDAKNFNYQLTIALEKKEVQSLCTHFLDHLALKRFTQEAKRLGITPIFDLVTNHVAKGAPITTEHKEWFGDDSTYPDAVAFKYADLLSLVKFSAQELDQVVSEITQEDLKTQGTKIKTGLISTDNTEEQRLFKLGLVHQSTKNRLSMLAFLSKHAAELAPYKEKILDGKLSEKKDIDAIKKLTIFSTPNELNWFLGEARKAYIPYEKMRAQMMPLIDTIVEQFWVPFISQYVELGFSGARVDCVRKVPIELRKQIYDKLKEKITERDIDSPSPIVILEEALFSDLSPEQFKEVVQDAGATHITGSLFNASREWHGGFNHDHAQEEYFKQQMASSGVINFTGNHDHYSCAMKVCYNLAREELNELLKEDTKIAGKTLKEYYKGGKITHAAQDIRDAIFLHHYVQNIIAKLQAGDIKLIKRFGKNYRDMMVSLMFQGSGGYYMLSGDESASFKQPTVFERDNGAPLYPQQSYAFLSDPSHELYQFAQEALMEKAFELAKKSSDKAVKELFSNANQDNSEYASKARTRLLSAFKAQLQNEINADTKTRSELITLMQEKYYQAAYNDATHAYHVKAKEVQPPLSAKQQRNMKVGEVRPADLGMKVISNFYAKLGKDNPFETDKLSVRRDPENRNKQGWEIATSITSDYANPEYFAQLNEVIDALPPSKPGYWSEIFKARDENILIVARKNGPGFDSDTDLVFINLDPYKSHDITMEDIEKCALWFQERKFPNAIKENVNVQWSNPEYHKAYGAIMGHSDHKQKPPKLYFVGKLTVNQNVRDYAISIDGQQEKFEFVVEPKPEQHPLIVDKPAEILSESDDEIPEEILKKSIELTVIETETMQLPLTRAKVLLHHYDSKQDLVSSSEPEPRSDHKMGFKKDMPKVQ